MNTGRVLLKAEEHAIEVGILDELMTVDPYVWYVVCYIAEQFLDSAGFASISKIKRALAALQVRYCWDPLLFEIGALHYREDQGEQKLRNKGRVALLSRGREYSGIFEKIAVSRPEFRDHIDSVIRLVKAFPRKGFFSAATAQAKLRRAPKILLADVGTEDNRVSGILPLLKESGPYKMAILFYNDNLSQKSAEECGHLLRSHMICLETDLIHTDVFDVGKSLGDVRRVLAEQGSLVKTDILTPGMSRINVPTFLAALKEAYDPFVQDSGLTVTSNWFIGYPEKYGDNPGEFSEMVYVGRKPAHPRLLMVPSGFDSKRVKAVIDDSQAEVSYLTTSSHPSEANHRSHETIKSILGSLPSAKRGPNVNHRRAQSMQHTLMLFQPEAIAILGSRANVLGSAVHYAQMRSLNRACVLVYPKQNYDRGRRFSYGYGKGHMEKVQFKPNGLVQLEDSDRVEYQ